MGLRSQSKIYFDNTLQGYVILGGTEEIHPRFYPLGCENLVGDFDPGSDLAELLKHGVQGKYAERYREGTNLVLLDPDVKEHFPDSESVNEALRSLIIQR